jgi:hypothetical protein
MGELNNEGRSSAQFRFHRDGAIVIPDDAETDRKPDPSPFTVLLCREEGFEYILSVLVDEIGLVHFDCRGCSSPAP